jgi:hypothetical protein
MELVTRASEMLEHVAHDLLLDTRIRHAHASVTAFIVVVIAGIVVLVTGREVILFFIGL